jgi:butyryl-CoA dehydrogenase
MEAPIAKYFCTEAAIDVTRKTVQIQGGYGFTKKAKVERLYRDIKLMEIFEGTNEMQRIIISWALLGPVV